jgi:outer membrane lipopolysaccharide assembly protein LptE/RlpB
MSAFRDLLKQAHEKGVKVMAFDVDLDQFFGDEQSKSWGATTGSVAGQGRTGEEALRHLVERL